MGFAKKLKDFMGIDEIDEDEDEEYEEEEVKTSSLIPKDKPIEIGAKVAIDNKKVLLNIYNSTNPNATPVLPVGACEKSIAASSFPSIAPSPSTSP